MGDETKTREELIAELAEMRRKTAEFQALEHQYRQSLNAHKMLEKAVETMQLGVTITDSLGKIVFTNPAEAAIHGFEVEELIGQDVRIFSPSKLWNPLKPIQIKQIKKYKRESENIRKDGTVFPVQIMSDVVLDGDGEPLGMVTSCEDISERKELEQIRFQAEVTEARARAMEEHNRELEELYQKEQAVTRTLQNLNQMRTSFLVVISHEMRTPLTILKGYNDLLLSGYCGHLPEDFRKPLTVSQGMIERLTASFENILEMLRLSKGQWVLHPVTFDLCGAVRQVVDMMTDFATQRGQKIHFTSPLMAEVMADPEKIELVIFNLVQNAIKFTPDDGEITISVKPLGDEVALTVTDSGIGIAPEEAGLVFETFYTHPNIAQHTSGQFEFCARGLGLGLAVAKGYVEAHKGKIWVESAGAGKGSSFHVVLPLQAKARNITTVTFEPIPTPIPTS